MGHDLIKHFFQVSPDDPTSEAVAKAMMTLYSSDSIYAGN
jgi:hypothetical protein